MTSPQWLSALTGPNIRSGSVDIGRQPNLSVVGATVTSDPLNQQNILTIAASGGGISGVVLENTGSTVSGGPFTTLNLHGATAANEGSGVGGLTFPGTVIGTYAARPAPGVVGRRYLCDPASPVEFADDGAAWRPLINGVLGHESAPANSLSTYLARNIQAGTVSSSVGGCVTLSIAPAGGAGSHCVQGFDVAYTTGQTLTVCLKPWHFPSADLFIFGAYLYDTVSGKADSVAVDLNNDNANPGGFGPICGRIDHITWPTLGPGASPSAAFSQVSNIGAGELIWFKIQQLGGGAVNTSYSMDGVNYNAISTAAGAVTFNRVGFFGDEFLVTPGGGGLVNFTVESFQVA